MKDISSVTYPHNVQLLLAVSVSVKLIKLVNML